MLPEQQQVQALAFFSAIARYWEGHIMKVIHHCLHRFLNSTPGAITRKENRRRRCSGLAI